MHRRLWRAFRTHELDLLAFNVAHGRVRNPTYAAAALEEIARVQGRIAGSTMNIVRGLVGRVLQRSEINNFLDIGLQHETAADRLEAGGS
jgi:hypothetical protein